MRQIRARNVNDALAQGLDEIRKHGIARTSRNGGVLSFPYPVITEYQNPKERVVTCPIRDCNPFFHHMESMWMLSGRNDLEFVKKYTKQMELYSTDGSRLNGAYGFRWREWFGQDQIKMAIHRLKKFPDDRRTVIQMWDGYKDLLPDNEELDVPCNTAIYLSILDGALNMTVTNRSNDMIWGAYGANAVHFSFLQEYIASMLDVSVGSYYQFSNNLHVYTDFGPYKKLIEQAAEIPCLYQTKEAIPRRLVNNKSRFMSEVEAFCEGSDDKFQNTFLNEVSRPIKEAHDIFKQGDWYRAVSKCHEIQAQDWRIACQEWLERRIAAKTKKV